MSKERRQKPQGVAVLIGTRHRSTRKRKLDDIDAEVQSRLDAIPADKMGPFWFQASTSLRIKGDLYHFGLQQRERACLEELVRTDFVNVPFLEKTLVPLNDEGSDTPRLRMFNWAVTNYAKGTAVITKVQQADGTTLLVDPAVSYNSTLKWLHRTLFDPYRRGTLLFYRVPSQPGLIHHTTVGQLLFVKWCLENGVDKYVSTHLEEIRKHLNATNERRKTMGSGRVKELTEAKHPMARMVK